MPKPTKSVTIEQWSDRARGIMDRLAAEWEAHGGDAESFFMITSNALLEAAQSRGLNEGQAVRCLQSTRDRVCSDIERRHGFVNRGPRPALH